MPLDGTCCTPSNDYLPPPSGWAFASLRPCESRSTLVSMPVAVIVAGGFGTRARGMTGGAQPKALLEVAGVPIIVRQLRVLAREGVERVVVLAGHLGEPLRAALPPEASRLGLSLGVTIEREPQGTAGSLRSLGEASGHDQLLVVYGDIVFDLCLPRLFAFHRRQGGIA